jgi:branched-chain amino acid transport system permease protein
MSATSTVLHRGKPGRLVGLLACLGLVAVLPYFMNGYQVRFTTTILMYIALAQAWNIIGGYAGYISLGLVGFVGLGGYATGVFMTLPRLSFPAALILAALLALSLALAIGPAILKLRAGYFAIATFGVAQVLRELTSNLTDVTGGGMGLSLPILPWDIQVIGRVFYYAMALLAVGSTLLVAFLDRTPLGYGLRAIKEDEGAAAVLGINTTLYKVIAFAVSAFIAALVGGAYAYWLTFIEPISMYDSTMSVTVIIMAMLGGAGTPIGPVIGGAVVSMISEYLWSRFIGIHLGTLGVSLILIVLFLPKGFMDLIRSGLTKKSPGDILRALVANASRYRA